MKYLLLLLIAISSVFSKGDSISDAKENYLAKEWHWEAIRIFELAYAPEKSSEFSDLDGYSNIDIANFYLLMPVVRKRIIWELGAWYRAVDADIANYVTNDRLDNTTHTVRALTAMVIPIKSGHYIYGEYHLGIDGNWNNLSYDAINHQFVLFWGLKLKRDRMFRAGLVYTRLFGKDMVLPVLGAAFRVGKRSAFDLIFPTHFLYRVRVAPKVETGVKIAIHSGDFGVDDVVAHPVELSYTQVSSTLYGDFTLVDNPKSKFLLKARIAGGFYFARTVTLNQISDGSEIMRASPKPSPMGVISLRWAI